MSAFLLITVFSNRILFFIRILDSLQNLSFYCCKKLNMKNVWRLWRTLHRCTLPNIIKGIFCQQDHECKTQSQTMQFHSQIYFQCLMTGAFLRSGINCLFSIEIYVKITCCCVMYVWVLLGTRWDMRVVHVKSRLGMWKMFRFVSSVVKGCDLSSTWNQGSDKCVINDHDF